MNKKQILKILFFIALLLTGFSFSDAVYAQRGSTTKQGRGVTQRGTSHQSKHRHKDDHVIIIPPEPEIVEEVVVPVEVVVVEHFDTVYAPVYYLPDPIKGHFSTYAGLRLSRADVHKTLWTSDADFQPGFNLGCRWDWYRRDRKYSAYNACGFKYELSHYWVEKDCYWDENENGYEHHSLNFFDIDYHFGFRWLRPNRDVCAIGFGPFFGISPYGKTSTNHGSYNSFEDGPFRNRLQYGADLEATYTHGHLFLCLAWSRTLNKIKLGETTIQELEEPTIQVGRCLSINAGYRF